MERSQKRSQLLVLIALLTYIITIFSLKDSPIAIFGIVGLLAGSMFFILLAWEDISKGILLWLSIFLLFGQENLFKFSDLPNLPLERIIWIFILLLFLIQISNRKIHLLPITILDYVMLIFIGICIASLMGRGIFLAKGKGFREFLNGFGIPFFTFWIGKNIFDDNTKINRLLLLLFYFALYLSITGILERLQLNYLIPHYYFINPIKGTHPGRLMGPLLNAAAYGTFFVMLFHLTFYLFSQVKGTKKRISQTLLFIMPILIFFTYTRAVWLSFLISLMLVFLLTPKSRVTYLIMLLCISALVLAYLPNILSADRTVGGILARGSINSRMDLYEASYNLFLEKPYLGHGFGHVTHTNIYLSQEELVSHDSFMSILVELGVIGFFFHCLIYYLLFKFSINVYKNSDTSGLLGRHFIIIYWAISVTYLLNSLIIEMRYFLLVNSLFFLLSGIVSGVHQRILIQEGKSHRSS